MTQDHDARYANAVIRFGEVAPEGWRDLEQPKERGGNRLALQSLRLASACKAEIMVADDRHLREGLILPQQVEVIA
jgi:hypothetical protein